MNAPPAVRYDNTDAEQAARSLPARLQTALEKALGKLLEDPYPIESEPLSPCGTRRAVRASQSVSLTYEVSGEGLHIMEVAGPPPPDTGGEAAEIAEDAGEEKAPATITTSPQPLPTSTPATPQT